MTAVVRDLIAASGAKPTYSLRDPRGIILSLIDHGTHNRRQGGGVCEEYTTIENTLPFVREICEGALSWTSSGLPCIFRYYDLVSRPGVEIVRLSQFLGLEVPEGSIEEIVDRERRTRRKGVLCFNTGLLTRFGDEMSLSEVALCNRELGTHIEELGYSA